MRYTSDPRPYDFYLSHTDFKPVLSKYLIPTHSILHLGNGTSRLPSFMLNDGFTNQICIDYSPIAVKACQDIWPKLVVKCMDATKITLDDNSIDAIIDKATLDSILCETDAPNAALTTLSEIHRVLKSGGVYIMVSYSDLGGREELLNKCSWEEIKVERVTISTGDSKKDGPFVFICKKCN